MYSEGEDAWLYPNFSLLLNGCDGTNRYGGEYRLPNGVLKPDDDYLRITVSSYNEQAELCDVGYERCWHTVGSAVKADADPEKALFHVAGSDTVCVRKCDPCMGSTAKVEIDLSYMDEGDSGGNYGTIRVPFTQDKMGTPTVR